MMPLQRHLFRMFRGCAVVMVPFLSAPVIAAESQLQLRPIQERFASGASQSHGDVIPGSGWSRGSQPAAVGWASTTVFRGWVGSACRNALSWMRWLP
jgi:hypothetical protein